MRKRKEKQDPPENEIGERISHESLPHYLFVIQEQSGFSKNYMHFYGEVPIQFKNGKHETASPIIAEHLRGCRFCKEVL